MNPSNILESDDRFIRLITKGKVCGPGDTDGRYKGLIDCQSIVEYNEMRTRLTIWNCNGITLKFSICTAGQSMKFAFSAGRYTS